MTGTKREQGWTHKISVDVATTNHLTNEEPEDNLKSNGRVDKSFLQYFANEFRVTDC